MNSQGFSSFADLIHLLKISFGRKFNFSSQYLCFLKNHPEIMQTLSTMFQNKSNISISKEKYKTKNEKKLSSTENRKSS